MVSGVASLILGIIPSTGRGLKAAITLPKHLRLHGVMLAMAALAVAMLATATLPASAHAQGVDNSLPPLADISITAVPEPGAYQGWLVSVKANRVGRHPLAVVRDVKVRLSAETVSPGFQVPSLIPRVRIDNAAGRDNGYYDGTSEIWTIPELWLNGREARAEITGPTIPFRAVPSGEIPLARVTAEIVASIPAEPPGFQDNNALEFWYVRRDFNFGDTGVEIRAVSDRSPGLGGTTDFTVRAENEASYLRDIKPRDRNDVQLGVKVKIELSPGLTFSGDPTAPSGTTFSATNPTTGIWNVGTLETLDRNAKSLPVAVNLTSDSLADLPLEERCLTAEVISAVPWFESDPSKRRNDIHTVCLGKLPEVDLRRHEVELFHYFDCVGVTSYPCTSGDTLELFVTRETGLGRVQSWHRWAREVTRRLGIGGRQAYLRPEQVTVHVQDVKWARHDGKWRTGKTKDHVVAVPSTRGVEAFFQFVPSGFSAYTFAISDVSPKQRPGAFSIIVGNSGTVTLLDPDTKPTFGQPRNLSTSTTSNPYPALLSFETLGTYKISLTVGATKSGTPYTDTGTYTFHVGPIAELEVRDAGASPAVAADRQAYTVMAVNNGPDEAPAVRVTGLPRGVTEFTASEGSYDPASGVWTIGRLDPGDYRSSGHADEGPTLTLITDDPADTEITAAIENTQDYCVRIKTGATDPANDEECSGTLPAGYTEHSAAYYDHVERNNSATITARAGTGEGAPGAPASLTTRGTVIGPVLSWEPVRLLNGHPVTHYEVQRLNSSSGRWEDVGEARDPVYLDEKAGTRIPAYRVRAVNRMGVGGPWSRSGPDAGPRPSGAPTVARVDIASTPGVGDAYQQGETIAVEVIFSEAVRVQGTPMLALKIGDMIRQVPMATHRGDTLTFRYAVAAGDTDIDGVSIPENGLTLPQGASITNFVRKVAVLGFAGLGNQAGHKVNVPYYVEPPPAPVALIATPGDGEVVLEWGTYCCDEKDIFYQLWRGDDPTWRNIAGSDRDTNEHTVSGLTNDVPYRFRVRAVYRHKADDGTVTNHPGAHSRTVAATPYKPDPNPPPNNPPVFKRPNDENFTVVERAPRGTEVARVRATDPDNDALTYTLSGENASQFSIANDANDKNVGVITVAEEELSYIWEPGGTSFSIGVEVTDDRGGRDNRVVGVEVTASAQRNNAPVAEEPGEFSVACNAAVGTTVGTIKADDPEGDSLWYILVDGAEEFKFKGGGTDHPDPIWSDDHAVLISDGSVAVLQVAKTLSGVCGELITVIVEIEEENNPGNNDTLSFQVRVRQQGTIFLSMASDEGGPSLLTTVKTWAGNAGNWWDRLLGLAGPGQPEPGGSPLKIRGMTSGFINTAIEFFESREDWWPGLKRIWSVRVQPPRPPCPSGAEWSGCWV